MFQFLIGTINPRFRLFPNVGVTQVSIPHRYDKPLRQVQNPVTFPFVSIPHRYDKPHNSNHSPSSLIIVSIPHRYDKPGYSQGDYCEVVYWFQFLIGTINPG